jgi:ABC-type branched-subunit amino acid transport system substrate-binding protein
MVGSMGAFDDGGAQTVQNCGIPDLRAAATEQGRINVPNVFGTMSLNASYIPTEPPKWYTQKFGSDVTSHAAMLWLAAGAAQLNGQNEMKGFSQAGMHFVYSAGIDVSAFNYSTYVSAMKSKGVKWVEFVGAIQYAVRLAQAMQAQDFHPQFVLDPEFYDPSFVQQGGSAVNGVHIWANQLPFEQVGQSPEMQLYETWLQRTNPGAVPNYFGLFAWAAGRLFVAEALALGGKLTRSAMVSALGAVDNYTGNGLFGPQHVGRKVTGSCYGFITLQNGKWVRENSGGDFLCAPVVKV